MYKIKRYEVLNDLELLLTEQLDREMSGRVASEIYGALIELIVNALNDESIDEVIEKPLTLIDRIDKQYRECEFHDYIRLITFNYTVQLAEKIRVYFITIGCPRYVKYKLEFSPLQYQNVTDFIKIDFETTSITLLERMGCITEIEQVDIVEDNPSLELLNEYYDSEKDC